MGRGAARPHGPAVPEVNVARSRATAEVDSSADVVLLLLNNAGANGRTRSRHKMVTWTRLLPLSRLMPSTRLLAGRVVVRARPLPGEYQWDKPKNVSGLGNRLDTIPKEYILGRSSVPYDDLTIVGIVTIRRT